MLSLAKKYLFHPVSTSQECTAQELGDIRVIGLTTEDAIAGRIELCNNGRWTAVCAGGWDSDDGATVCRQALNLSQSGIQTILYTYCTDSEHYTPVYSFVLVLRKPIMYDQPDPHLVPSFYSQVLNS